MTAWLQRQELDDFPWWEQALGDAVWLLIAVFAMILIWRLA